MRESCRYSGHFQVKISVMAETAVPDTAVLQHSLTRALLTLYTRRYHNEVHSIHATCFLQAHLEWLLATFNPLYQHEHINSIGPGSPDSIIANPKSSKRKISPLLRLSHKTPSLPDCASIMLKPSEGQWMLLVLCACPGTKGGAGHIFHAFRP